MKVIKWIVLMCSCVTAYADVSHDFALKKLIENMSIGEAVPGMVIAAKSKSRPNYYYHWVRDAALVYDALLVVYPDSSKSQQQWIHHQLEAYRKLTEKLQQTPALSGLGEPKFNLDGSAYNEAWGRPQNDGPALRAISLIHWANILIREGQINEVRQHLYLPELPARSPVKVDLEYISHHWQDPGFDLWEEVKGMHFYTLMVIRKALLDGADLAVKLQDVGAADWYRKQAHLVEEKLGLFIDKQTQLIKPTINQVGGMEGKQSNMDVAVILGLLHGGRNDGFLSWDDPVVVSTMIRLIQVFQDLYPINHHQKAPGVAIGRYPEDHYSGSEVWQGNPWVICTYAMAEAAYQIAHRYLQSGQTTMANEMIKLGQQQVARVRFHAHADGSLSEQMDRYTGYMTSASDLTWNYAAYLTLEHAFSEI